MLRNGLLAFAVIIAGIVAVTVAHGMIRDMQENPADHFTEPDTLALAEALMANDGARIAELLAAGADLDAGGRDGMTMLQWQIFRGDHRRFRWLLDLGADPDAPGWYEDTAVHLAAQYMNTSFLEILLDHGANPNAVNKRQGQTPLFNALDTRRQDNVELLIARGADIEHADLSGTRPLLHAARINSSENVVRFLQLGADPEATDNLGVTFQPSFFRTDPALLSHEARRSREWVVDFLTERGIAVDPQASRLN
jgi:ankyrin repeat protein